MLSQSIVWHATESTDNTDADLTGRGKLMNRLKLDAIMQ